MQRVHTSNATHIAPFRALVGLATAALLAGGLAGCASTPAPQPVAVSKIAPGANQRVIDQLVILFDTSGSVDEATQFPSQRALLQSFVGGMPDGSYEVSVITFGGVDRDIIEQASFNRGALGDYAANVEYLDDGTPLHTVLREASTGLQGKGSKASVVVVTDGLPSDAIGRAVSSELALSAARDLAGSYAGDLCIHTVQLGNDPAGAAFLSNLAGTTPCGSTRAASSLNTEMAFQSLERDALLAPLPQVAAPPPAVVAAPIRDLDGDRDGVLDSRDQCPRTPTGARVDSRGCWVIPELYFKTDTSEFSEGSQRILDEEVLPVLRKTPGLRVRIDGHTDATGGAAYNQQLSERRAAAVRDMLVSDGIAGDRIQTQGFGEANPIAPNNTAAGRKVNRRTEITVLR